MKGHLFVADKSKSNKNSTKEGDIKLYKSSFCMLLKLSISWHQFKLHC